MPTADERSLASSVPDPVLAIVRRLASVGRRAWVVGGCVRDVLLARREGAAAASRNDWDLATDARPEEVMRAFPRVIPTGLRHGTVTVLDGGVAYEVTTLRGDVSYSDGRRPDAVRFVDDLVEDLARRDFTVNAMAWDPIGGRLVDPFGGVADLEAKLLRAVGEPAARFAEDGLRVLRAARFVATLELELEERTAQAIEPSLASYRKVSAERIRDEWMKTMKARRPSRAFEVMRAHGLLEATAPELLDAVGCEQNRHHAWDVWTHTLACVDACPPEAVLRVAALLHDIGKPRSRELSSKTNDYTFHDHERIGAEIAGPLLERLRFSNDERGRVVALVRHHLVCYDERWTDAAVRRWVRRVGTELLPELYTLVRADVRAKGRDADDEVARVDALEARAAALLAAGAALGVADLAVNGAELVRAVGRTPGPWVGEVLRQLVEEVIEDPARNERGALLERGRALATSRA
ncbi:MAG: HD domain-containing protein [Polyangiaceae bacterium]|nr:HD domain-containing protein [Polyangiaceae bacterium]